MAAKEKDRDNGKAAPKPAAEEKFEIAGSVADTVAKLKELEAKRERGVLYVGIDLGTSRTSVAASNGVRATVWSFVGYPKDLVSRKALKKDVLFGKEALDNRLSVDLYRPLEKGVIKYSDGANGASEAEVERNMQAAKDLVKHAISLARPRKDELIYGVIGCPAQASIRNKQSIIEAAREVLDSVVICSEPFAVAYGLDVLTDALVIDIGAGTTDLCRMKGAMPDETDQITNSFAGDFVDQELFRLLKERCTGAQFTIHQVKELKERYSFVDELSQPVRIMLPVGGKPRQFDITAEVRKACISIVPPMVEAVEKLVATFDPEFQPRIRNNILLGGGGSQIHGLGRAIEEALQEYGGGRVRTVEEPVYAGANGALAIAQDMPEDTWEQLG
jgi:rod shape-determining protein MreB